MEDDHTIPEPCLNELSRKDKKTVTLCVSMANHQAAVVQVEQFSTLNRLQRNVAQVFRFIQLLQRKDINVESRRLMARDMELAHKYLWQVAQSTLTQNRRFESWKLQFGLIKDQEGL